MQFLYTIIISDKQARDRTLQHEDHKKKMNLFLIVYLKKTFYSVALANFMSAFPLLYFSRGPIPKMSRS